MRPGKRAGVANGESERGVWAARLERVRTELGYGSLRSFWLDLTDEGPVCSYEAATNYHYRDREPSAAYLAAVGKRFDVSYAFLLLGEGDP